MSISTITIQNSLDFISPGLPANLNKGGTGVNPVLSAANMVLQRFLAPPFAWPWNRVSLQLTTTAGQTDYSSGVSDVGFIEAASITQTAAGLETYEIPERRLVMLKGTETGRPQCIAPVIENPTTGLVTFRVSPAPDTSSEIITVIYQKIPPRITALQGTLGTWTPIPDRFSSVYQAGLQYYMLMQSRDEIDRQMVPLARQDFLAGLLSISEGLDESQKYTFLQVWDIRSAQNTSAGIRPQQGAQARQS